MIEVQHLVKWYGPNLAVDDLTFAIPAGQVVGFLGRNGAGKTTTLRIITGYMPPTSGQATLCGFDAFKQSLEARRRIGYLPESTPLYPEMRVEEFLHFRGKLQGMDRVNRRQRINLVCDRCGLGLVRRRLIGQLSKGNKQRVGLAQALLHDPPVIILDEPTSGLDPNQTVAFRKLLGELRGEHTIVLSTHNLGEIEKTADRALIIESGRIRYDQMIERGARLLVEVEAAAEAARHVLGNLADVASVEILASGAWSSLVILPRESRDVRAAVGQALLANGWVVRELRAQTTDLERRFREVTTGEIDNPSAASAA